MARHVRNGDVVVVTSGSAKGQTGTVIKVHPRTDQVVVQGVNLRTKHLKPTQANPQGGIIRKEMPLHISNVSPLVEDKPTRVRFETRPDGTKVRVAVRNGKELSVVRRPKRSRGANAPASDAGA